VCLSGGVLFFAFSYFCDGYPDAHRLHTQNVLHIYSIWQFPLKMLHPRNLPYQATQILWYLAVQFKLRFWFHLNLYQRFYFPRCGWYRGCSILSWIGHTLNTKHIVFTQYQTYHTTAHCNNLCNILQHTATHCKTFDISSSGVCVGKRGHRHWPSCSSTLAILFTEDPTALQYFSKMASQMTWLPFWRFISLFSFFFPHFTYRFFFWPHSCSSRSTSLPAPSFMWPAFIILVLLFIFLLLIFLFFLLLLVVSARCVYSAWAQGTHMCLCV